MRSLIKVRVVFCQEPRAVAAGRSQIPEGRGEGSTTAAAPAHCMYVRTEWVPKKSANKLIPYLVLENRPFLCQNGIKY